MSNIIQADFNGQRLHFTSDAWFNATEAASHYGKEPGDWLRQRDTVDYLAALASYHGNSDFVEEFNAISGLPSTSAASQSRLLKLAKQSGYVRTKAGNPQNGGGTWLHPKLAVRFAQWLDVRFAIWCDLQIDAIVRGTSQPQDWQKFRIEASSRFKGVCEMLNLSRQADGKHTAAHHYINEAKLINWAFCGSFMPIKRDALSAKELRLLELLEAQDMLLLGRGMPYAERKQVLTTFATQQRQRMALPLAGRLSDSGNQIDGDSHAA